MSTDASFQPACLADYMEAVARRHAIAPPEGYGYKALPSGDDGGANVGFLLEVTSQCMVLEKPVVIPSGKPELQGYVVLYAYCAKGGIESLLGGNLPKQLPATTKDPKAFGSKEAISKNFGNAQPAASAAAGNSDYCVAFRVPAELAHKVDLQDYDLWMIRLDQDMITPFLQAAKEGDAATVAKALEAGVDGASVDEGGIPALLMAAAASSVETCQALLAKGAKVNAAEPTNSRTALMAAAQAGAVPVVNLLLSANADAAKVDSEGQTALMWAAVAGEVEVAQVLAGSGIKDVKNNEGLTALDIAEKMGKGEVAQVLKG